LRSDACRSGEIKTRADFIVNSGVAADRIADLLFVFFGRTAPLRCPRARSAAGVAIAGDQDEEEDASDAPYVDAASSDVV
jgi:hypothetical protein